MRSERAFYNYYLCPTHCCHGNTPPPEPRSYIYILVIIYVIMRRVLITQLSGVVRGGPAREAEGAVRGKDCEGGYDWSRA